MNVRLSLIEFIIFHATKPVRRLANRFATLIFLPHWDHPGNVYDCVLPDNPLWLSSLRQNGNIVGIVYQRWIRFLLLRRWIFNDLHVRGFEMLPAINALPSRNMASEIIEFVRKSFWR
jgi:hypothetical protein